MSTIYQRVADLEEEIWKGNGDPALKVRVAKLEQEVHFMEKYLRARERKLNIILGASLTAGLTAVGDLLLRWLEHGVR